MLIVIPVCHKDAAICRKNLEWVARLDPMPYPYTAVVSHDTDFDPTEILALASKRFSTVLQHSYRPWRGQPQWPFPQNHAWQAAARWIEAKPKESWLWWEQDAVPVRPGWLRDIVEEYARAAKPFMGYCADDYDGHMNGVGCYPHDLSRYTTDGLLCRAVAFDLVMGKDIRKNVHKANHLFRHQVNADLGPNSFKTYTEALALIDRNVALFHRCKDGSLIDVITKRGLRYFMKRLLGKDTIACDTKNGETIGPVVTRKVSDVTVVITNYQRAEMLWEAYQSCRRARVQHIVISCSAANQYVQTVLQKIKRDFPSVVTSVRDDDGGCNENWLRGARLVQTSRMTILHDDDQLLPAYESVVSGKLESDVIHWDGKKHGPNGVIPGTYVTRGDLPSGQLPITYLLPFLLYCESYTLSPVCGCYPREHVIETLEECEREFGPWAYLRPTMMVGNDLLLWLRACEKFRTVYYSHEPFCSYGHWLGSASFDDAVNKRMGLLPIYKATRRYFVEHAPKMLHVVPRYLPKTNEATQRIRGAIPTWELGYSYEMIRPNHQWSWHRDSTTIKEPKQTPFLKDVLARARETAVPGEMILLTNDDSILNTFFWFSAWNHLKDHGAGCSFRRNIAMASDVNPWQYQQNPPGHSHVGRDAFFFRQEWLREHWDEIPDYLMGFGDWDSTLAMLIRLCEGDKPKADEMCVEHPLSEIPSGTVYHVDHRADWTLTFDTKGMQHNRALTDEFFKRRLGWSMPKLRGTW